MNIYKANKMCNVKDCLNDPNRCYFCKRIDGKMSEYDNGKIGKDENE